MSGMRLLAVWAALALVALAPAAGQDPGVTRGFGAEAAVIRGACPADSLYGENFYVGASVLEAAHTVTLAGCCSLCADTDGCSKWTYCHMNVAGGCVAPVGPLANTTFEPGTCLLSSSLAADRRTAITWSFAQPGVPWVAGEDAGDAAAATITETADNAEENIERVKFDTSEDMHCRVVLGGPLQLSPLGSQGAAAGPAVEEGQELRYTGLRLTDGAGAEWAVVFSADSGSLWRYPAADLGYCNTTSSVCPASEAGGAAEEGASCASTDECCGTLQCLPRGTESVWVSWADGASSGKVVFGGPQDTSGLRLLPGECARPNSADSVERLEFGGADEMFCLSVTTGSLNLTGLNGEAGPAVAVGQELYWTGLRVSDASGGDWAVVFYPAQRSLWRYPTTSLSPCNGTVPGCDSAGAIDAGASCGGDDECCPGLTCQPRPSSNVWVSWADTSGSGRVLFGSGSDHRLRLLPNACEVASGGDGSTPTGRQQFDAPQWDGFALDFCTAPGQGCGQAAADAFCEGSGFARAADWSGPVALDASQELAISADSGAFCKVALQQCQTFYFVTCTHDGAAL